MLCLKENKTLVVIALMIPVSFWYFDKMIVDWVSDFYQAQVSLHPALESADYAVRLIAKGTIPVFVAVTVLLVGKLISRRLYDMWKPLAASLIAAGLSVQILKHLVGRARPRVTDATVFAGLTLQSGYDSFPSGHSTAAFCLAYVFAQYFPRYAIVFYLFPLAVGFERVVHGSHFPSDILGGAILGLIIGKTVLFLWRRGVTSSSSPTSSSIWRE